MEQKNIFPVPTSWSTSAWVNRAKYRELYRRSLDNNEDFWAEQAQRLSWDQPWDKVKDVSFQKPVKINWFLGAKLNVSVNCIDRHLQDKADTVAYHFVPEDPKQPVQDISYQMLHDKVCQWSHALIDSGVTQDDRVTIYMPMIPEAVYAMLACARIGAAHSVVFGGFSPEALADRIRDCESRFLITADQGRRGGKAIELKRNADAAAKSCPHLQKIFVVRSTGANVPFEPSRDIWINELAAAKPTDFKATSVDSEHPLFLLYTSGSTNKPKGVLHTCGGYLTYVSFTHQMVFDYHPGDVYWCAADIGWVTGHSYIVYGPLANGATSVLYEGLPTYPDASRLWQIIDQLKVNILYTAPTLIRSLMALGTEPLKSTRRDSLKVLGSVGEPINPEAWRWYHREIGHSSCPVVDTWWQTETGGILISPLPGATDLKPGFATKPLFGIQPVLINDKGDVQEGAGEGYLCLADSWPGQMRTIYKDHARFEETYFSQYPGYYFSGDGAKRDEDGDFLITGRVDDILNVSGHRLGTAEVESVLVAHPKVAEAAVVGFPHEIKGQGIYAYVTLNKGEPESETLVTELKERVKQEIGGLARPDIIQWAPQLPKTRSGKIMRRILRKIAENEFDKLGDTSTLADPEVVRNLIAGRAKA